MELFVQQNSAKANQPGDFELLKAARGGDQSAFAQLWERHRGAGIRAARSICPRLDPEDVVSEAYIRILEQIRNGGGPNTVFRPYLYQVIRSISMGARGLGEYASEDIDEFPSEDPDAPWEDTSYDHSATIAAYAKLPERWQEVLWYCEVEGLPPRKVAELIDESPNNVSALLLRAKKGLRTEWIEAHLDPAVAGPACARIRPQLQRFTSKKLRPSAHDKVASHLEGCEQCRAAQHEMGRLTSGIGLTLATAFLGPSAEAFLASLTPTVVAAGGAAMAAPIVVATLAVSSILAGTASAPLTGDVAPRTPQVETSSEQSKTNSEWPAPRPPEGDRPVDSGTQAPGGVETEQAPPEAPPPVSIIDPGFPQPLPPRTDWGPSGPPITLPEWDVAPTPPPARPVNPAPQSPVWTPEPLLPENDLPR